MLKIPTSGGNTAETTITEIDKRSLPKKEHSTNYERPNQSKRRIVSTPLMTVKMPSTLLNIVREYLIPSRAQVIASYARVMLSISLYGEIITPDAHVSEYIGFINQYYN